MFELKKLRVWARGKPVIKEVSLRIKAGQVHFLMGPNGSGKTTLVMGIAGHPGYKTRGKVLVNGREVSGLEPDQRFQAGLFTAFQFVPDLPGIKLSQLGPDLERAGLDPEFAEREMRGLSGGEKKKLEVAQLVTRQPRAVVLDEPDSGLDVDSFKQAGQLLQDYVKEHMPAILIITHNANIAEYLTPDRVHILQDGKIACSGGPEVLSDLGRLGLRGVVDDRC
jgi:Fe-S cluster assembly ATP-binding protein